MEIVVKALVLTVLVSLGVLHGATAQQDRFAGGLEPALPLVDARFEAPVGHRQPSIAEIDQGKAARDFRSPTEISADEAYRRSEEGLRKKLIICRC
jgi:hypothetical protein